MFRNILLFMYNLGDYISGIVIIDDEFIELLVSFFENNYEKYKNEIDLFLGINKKEQIAMVLLVVFDELKEVYFKNIMEITNDDWKLLKLLDEIGDDMVAVIDFLNYLFVDYTYVLADIGMSRIRH